MQAGFEAAEKPSSTPVSTAPSTVTAPVPATATAPAEAEAPAEAAAHEEALETTQKSLTLGLLDPSNSHPLTPPPYPHHPSRPTVRPFHAVLRASS